MLGTREEGRNRRIQSSEMREAVECRERCCWVDDLMPSSHEAGPTWWWSQIRTENETRPVALSRINETPYGEMGKSSR